MHHLAPEFDENSWQVDLGGIHVVFGEGRLAELGVLAQGLGRRALLVTDRGIEVAGHAGAARRCLEEAGLEVAVFDGVAENPTTEHVALGVEAAQRHRPDLLVGLGGGSSMDCAKGINFLYTNGGKMEDYWGDGRASQPMLPAIGIPTTAGTGSEGQRFALISRAESHVKMACGDRKARFHTVILDPRLVSSMPREVAAVTGMDALSHALESFVTRRRNPVSQLFAREAWRLIESSFETFLDHPADPTARGKMMLGAHLGGAAIEASMLGAAHSCANPLTAHYDLTHGTAVGLMLPHVIRFNAREVDHLYGELLQTAGLNGQPSNPDLPPHGQRLSERVSGLQGRAGLPLRLSSCGVEEHMLAQLAEEAVGQWTAHFNPRSVAREDLQQLYRDAL